MRVQKTVKDKIGLYMCRHKYVQDFFVVSAADMPRANRARGQEFFDIDNIDDYRKICEKYNFRATDADEEKRFCEKSHFCLLAEDGHFGCWGWYSTARDDFYVLEIDRRSPVPENTTVLYHYFTNARYRRRGYYTQLLRSVVFSSGKEYSVIYAYDTNDASTGAIKKAGFRYVGRFGHKNFPGFEKLVSEYKRGIVKS